MTHRFPSWLLLPVLCANGLHAQIDTAQARVKHLMEQVDTEMKEIDRLLLTGAGRGAAAGAQTAAERSSKKLSELLLQARKSQDSAGENIKKLIEELEKLSQQNQQQQQQHQGQKPEQQKQPKDGEQPTGPDQNPTTGQNKVGGKPPQAGEEQVPRGVDSQRWGVLPKYLEFMHARGSLPEVPERYRRLYEAYLKSGQKPPTPDPRK